NVREEVAEIVASFGIPLVHSDQWYGEAVPKKAPDPEPPVIGGIHRSELQYMAENEMVVHLEDFLRRRTMLGLTLGRDALRADPGLPEAARILFGEDAEAEIARFFD
ncbi:MAG: hypothetical protein K9L89_01250, partial [Kiritimatiellales bacterium]|nr:hypothetical protein [Kiritimatiellales bacterium]